MALSLPFTPQLDARADWSGRIHSVTMRAANTSIRGTVGFNPQTETVTLHWWLYRSQIDDWLAVWAANPNGRFAYTCGIRGELVLRPGDSYSFTDYDFVTQCSMQFERV